MNKAVFIDKDGTLIVDVPYNINPHLIQFTEGAVQALRELKEKGYLLILISNQSGVARGFFEEAHLEKLKAALQERLRPSGAALDGIFFCPHHPQGTVPAYAIECCCRKPEPGMIFQAVATHNIDLTTSWMIGDILHDIEAGNRAGCKTILIDNGNETEWTLNERRNPTAIVKSLPQAAALISLEHQMV